MAEYGAAINFASRPTVRAAITIGTTLTTLLGAAGKAAASEVSGLAPSSQYLLAAEMVAAGGAALAAFLVWYNNRPVRLS